MGPVVLDCSVAIFWLMPDEFFDSCFLDRVVTEGALVSSIWPLEIGNTLLMAERQKRLSAEQRHQAVFTLSELPTNVDPMTLSPRLARNNGVGRTL